MTRVQLLHRLLSMDGPVTKINNQLAEFGWDSEEEFVVLEGKYISIVLEKYLENAVSGDDVGHWANSIECREDIGRPESKPNREVIDSVIYELANPNLTQALSRNRAHELLSKLS